MTCSATLFDTAKVEVATKVGLVTVTTNADGRNSTITKKQTSGDFLREGRKGRVNRICWFGWNNPVGEAELRH